MYFGNYALSNNIDSAFSLIENDISLFSNLDIVTEADNKISFGERVKKFFEAIKNFFIDIGKRIKKLYLRIKNAIMQTKAGKAVARALNKLKKVKNEDVEFDDDFDDFDDEEESEGEPVPDETLQKIDREMAQFKARVFNANMPSMIKGGRNTGNETWYNFAGYTDANSAIKAYERSVIKFTQILDGKQKGLFALCGAIIDKVQTDKLSEDELANKLTYFILSDFDSPVRDILTAFKIKHDYRMTEDNPDVSEIIKAIENYKNSPETDYEKSYDHYNSEEMGGWKYGRGVTYLTEYLTFLEDFNEVNCDLCLKFMEAYMGTFEKSIKECDKQIKEIEARLAKPDKEENIDDVKLLLKGAKATKVAISKVTPVCNKINWMLNDCRYCITNEIERVNNYIDKVCEKYHVQFK